MNIGAPWPDLEEAEQRVLTMQTSCTDGRPTDPGRRFDDLFNLVYDPAFLVVAWERVRGNRGATLSRCRWDRSTTRIADVGAGWRIFESDLKARRFRPDRVREGMIPKAQRQVASAGDPDRRATGWCRPR